MNSNNNMLHVFKFFLTSRKLQIGPPILLILVTLFLVFALGSCQKPMSPEFDSEYDEQSERFIPFADLNTSSVTQIRAQTAVSGGQFVNDYGKPLTQKGVCWSLAQIPTVQDTCSQLGPGLSPFTSTLTNLVADTRYYVRAYATNADGTTYGQQLSFKTLDGKPVFGQAGVSAVTTTSATVTATISSDEGKAITGRGVCYATTENPTTEDTCVASGSGTGSYSVTLSGLRADTDYYVRAYATNTVGTSYGDQVEFTTTSSTSTSGRDTQTAVVDVRNPVTGRTWMDRNLGASRAATSSTDALAYGDLYQWGRRADGHEKRNSPTTTTLSTTDTPSHGSFILATNSPNDWRSPQNNNLWQGVNGVNNPCPVGYRIPTAAEWTAERQSWSNNNASGAINSLLKLPMAGRRSGSSGSLSGADSRGDYWSSSVSGSSAQRLYFDSTDALVSITSYRAFGYSVRCLKD
jgi:uncharacterized protein (TIGR02145 family)